MGLTFEQPWWLLTALIGVPIAWIAVRRFPLAMGRARMVSAIVARCVLLALLALALAGASGVRTSDRLAVVAVVDVSDSIRAFADRFADLSQAGDGEERLSWSDAIERYLREAIGGRTPEDLFGMVVFDGRSLAVAVPSSAPFDGLTVDYRLSEGSDLEGALRFANLLFPPDASKRLLLVSDGVETSGDALAAARALGSSAQIDVVPIAYRVRGEVMIEAVDAPPRTAPGSRIPVRVVLNATAPTRGRLELRYNGELIDANGSLPGLGLPLALEEGRRVVELSVALTDGVSIHRIEPVFVPSEGQPDGIIENNMAQAVTITPTRGSVLIVDGRPDGELGGRNPLFESLDAAGIKVSRILAGELPSDLLALQAHDLVILQDVAAEDVPRSTHALLAEYVSGLGGGLVMVGGENGFGAGNWKNTPVEDILPVLLDLPEDIVVPTAAIAIVLDSSGSMGASVLGGMRSQQDIANEGAAQAVMTLDKSDLLMVVEFDSVDRVVVPMGPNTSPEQSVARIRAITQGGGTNLFPAMATAGDALVEASAGIKHMIILSDGQSQGDPNDMILLAQRLNEAGVSVSTIAVGDGADAITLADIARNGGGVFHPVTNPNEIPRIFLKEVRVVRKPLIREEPFTPVVIDGGSPLIAGLPGWSPPTPPELRGLVLTQARSGASVTNALSTPDGFPLLAHWVVGRGQVAAFTSDASVWALDWLGNESGSQWRGYSALWTQIARAIARPAVEQNAELRMQVVGDQLLISVEATDDDGDPMDGLTVEGQVRAPSGELVDVVLRQTGPGQYQGATPAPEQGNYVVTLLPSRGARQLAPLWGGASRAIGPEFQTMRSDIGLMQRIAETTGGRVFDLSSPLDRSALYDRAGTTPARSALPIWRILIVWAIVVFLVDVGTRRVAWDRLIRVGLEGEAAVQRASGKAGAKGLAQRLGKRREQEATRTASAVQAKPGTPADRGADMGAALKGAKARAEARVDGGADREAQAETAKASAKAPTTKPEPSKPKAQDKPTEKPAAKPDEDADTTSSLLAMKRRRDANRGG